MNALSKAAVAVAVLFVAATVRAEGFLRCCAELNAEIDCERPSSRGFAFEAVVTSPARPVHDTFAVTDGTGATRISIGDVRQSRPVRRGDRVRLSGHVAHNGDFGYNFAAIDSLALLASGEPPPPVETTVGGLFRPELVNRTVRFEGDVIDAFRDDTDLRYVFFVIAGDDGATVYVPTSDYRSDDDSFRALVGSRVSVDALCICDSKGVTKRKLDVNFDDTPKENFRIVRPAPEDPFAVPELSGTLGRIRENGLHAQRRRLHGTVLAVWPRDNLLVRRDSGEVSRVTLADAASLPACGDVVDAVGMPDTDLYHLNLSLARWRPAGARRALPEPEGQTDARALLTDGHGNRQIEITFHGHTVRLRGAVIGTSPAGSGESVILLETDGGLLSVDCSAAPAVLNGISRGCRIEVTGIFITETPNWRPQDPFPVTEHCLLALRTAADVTVLSTPSWWTPGRSFTIILALVTILFAFFVWNRILTRLARRRWQALAREQLVRAKANLKAEERTRLAIELHDTIVQNLTGAAMEVETARRLAGNEAAMLEHISTAERTLKSSREELRDCLWDLRSHAFEEKDMTAAIKRTLRPRINETELRIRFNVPTARLPENVVHAVLRIVRELTLNAIRHGKATEVSIAGSYERGCLLFAVSDNGSGFDPEVHPDGLQGHYGIQGVRERVGGFKGSVSIESTPGHGTRVRVDIPIHPRARDLTDPSCRRRRSPQAQA